MTMVCPSPGEAPRCHRNRKRFASRNPTGSPRPMGRCAGRRNGSANRWRPRITSCSRCPTPARPSGTWRTRPGSSRRSCSPRRFRTTARSTRSYGYLFNSYYEAVGDRLAAAAARPAVAADGGGGVPLPRRTSMQQMRTPSASGRRADCCRRGRRARAGPEPRAAASGTDPDRPQARLRPPTRCGRPTATGRPGHGGRPPCRAAVAYPGRRDVGSGTTGDGFAFDNEAPRHRVFVRPSGWHRGW